MDNPQKVVRVKAGTTSFSLEYRQTTHRHLRVKTSFQWLASLLQWLGWTTFDAPSIGHADEGDEK